MSDEARVNAILERLAAQTSLPGIALGLDRVEACLARLGNPHLRLPPVIHIAGTNGKGSTLAYLRAMAEASGMRVHAYTSPHLVRFHERIVLDGALITDHQLLSALETVLEAAENMALTFFEATTIAAFVAFAETPADLVLLEVGLGGRLDATNVVPHPLACVITPIDEDHKEFLGDTLAHIAAEKMGIYKPGAIFVSAQQHAQVQAVIQTHVPEDAYLYGRDWQCEGAELSVRGNAYRLPDPALAGQHQWMNAACAFVTALAVSEALPFSLSAMNKGVAHASWPARLQQLIHGPLVPKDGELWLDGGHNPAAAEVVAAWVSGSILPVGLMVGMLSRKDSEGYFRHFAPLDLPIATISFEGEDAYSAKELADSARKAGCVNVQDFDTQQDALIWLQGQGARRLLACGSLYLAGKLLQNHS